jgi:hypothetical protein
MSRARRVAVRWTIHRVGTNHGPRLGEFDGRDYACDRTEAASIWMFICGTIGEQRNYER